MGDGPQTRIHNALRFAEQYGDVEGAGFKAWVLRTIEALCSLPGIGAAASLSPITDIWS